ncbi:MAG: ribosome small subunit-dependent GTPase A [Rikenellaceae bacterium]
MNKGIVTKNTGSWYCVESEDGKVYNCRIRGKLRLKGIRTTNPISVGDNVVFDIETDNNDNSVNGVITKIEPRKNYIIRKSTNLSKESHILASNLDNVFLVVTLDFPFTSNEFIDRFLVTCEVYKVPVTIVLNKIDLFSDEGFKEVIEDFHKLYNSASYEVINCSTISHEGIATIEEMMKGKISLFSGNSGVGKSSIIKVVTNDLNIKTGDVSDSHHKGKHTTTFSEMFKINDGGYLIDTPGIKGFGLIDIDKDELARYFPDMFKHSSECRFYNCTHTHEPGCAVKEAVQEGAIYAERYDSYLKMLENDKEEKYR